MSGPDGALVVDKPRGPTSHDVVSQARRLFDTRAVGHAGTLDPLATGVLVLLFGEATKLSAYVTSADKSYRATVSLGTSTTTLDAEGKPTETVELPPDWFDAERLASALAAEAARTEQIPPAFSAIKVNGKSAHEKSRRGEAVELQPRRVRVERVELIDHDADRLTVDLTVSKGYYVRSFARDLSWRLGLPGHLASLRRVASGPFSIETATAWPPSDRPELIPTVKAAEHALVTATLTAEGEASARCGRHLSETDFATAPDAEGPAAWLGPSGQLVAIGERRKAGAFAVLRGFNL